MYILLKLFNISQLASVTNASLLGTNTQFPNRWRAGKCCGLLWQIVSPHSVVCARCGFSSGTMLLCVSPICLPHPGTTSCYCIRALVRRHQVCGNNCSLTSLHGPLHVRIYFVYTLERWTETIDRSTVSPEVGQNPIKVDRTYDGRNDDDDNDDDDVMTFVLHILMHMLTTTEENF